MAILWSTESPRKQPMEVAASFAASQFGEPRRVDPDTLVGVFTDVGYRGHFALVDGVKVYRLYGDTEGNWWIYGD